MKQVAGLISTYSSDEFGICSALYELGGMVVMHDASGCNSTYTTHDEPRWYDMESMIYISAISEMEAIMGDDDKLIHDVIETAQQMKPKFIALVGAPIPYMIGTDLKAIAAIIEEETGIPSFGLEANGMNGYLSGISMAFDAIVDRFCKKEVLKSTQTKVNILGATPLDFSLNGSIDSIRRWIKNIGMQTGACFAMGSSLEELSKAGKAQVNLVISYGAMEIAKKMEEEFDIPYVVGVPVGKLFAATVEHCLKESLETGKSQVVCQKYKADIRSEKKAAIIGESVYATSLAGAIEQQYGISCEVLCPLETEEMILRSMDKQTPEEDDLMEALEGMDIVIADPLYKPLCPKKASFYPLGHIAFSGRIYENKIPDLIDREFEETGGLR